jgi:hypothetical protein
VCGENFKRHPPAVIGADRRNNKLTTWDIKANAEASRLYGQETNLTNEPDLDLPAEHRRDSSGRTAAAEAG